MNMNFDTIFLWQVIVILTRDPLQARSRLARQIVARECTHYSSTASTYSLTARSNSHPLVEVSAYRTVEMPY